GPEPRAGDRGTIEAQSARALDRAERGRRHRVVVMRRRRRCHHRAGDRGCGRRDLKHEKAEGDPMSRPANPVTVPLADYPPKHCLLAVVDGVAPVPLNRPDRKNPLTFESYRELTDFFRACAFDDEVKVVVVTGAGGNFSSGGDVFEIIGPLVKMDT